MIGFVVINILALVIDSSFMRRCMEEGENNALDYALTSSDPGLYVICSV